MNTNTNTNTKIMKKQNLLVAGLINKPMRTQNRKLAKQLRSVIPKTFEVDKKVVTKELNTFIICRGKKDLSSTSKKKQSILYANRKEFEQCKICQTFTQYYQKLQQKLHRELKQNKELQETSDIIKQFLRLIDPTFVQDFNSKLTQLKKEFPEHIAGVAESSLVVIQDINELIYQCFLNGTQGQGQIFFYGSKLQEIPNPAISLSQLDSLKVTELVKKHPVQITEIIDKIMILNFLLAFMPPTLSHLSALNDTMDNLETVLLKQKVASSVDKEIHKKTTLYLRILITKLNALQELNIQFTRVLNLIEVPKITLSNYPLQNDSLHVSELFERMEHQVNLIKDKLDQLNNRFNSAQLSLTELLDFMRSGIRTTSNMEQFKNGLKPLAEISIELFIQTEFLNKWSDFFGTDIPYFSFNTNIFKSDVEEDYDIDSDVILASRGLFKNYRLGETTVYAVRGVDLDIKEGEFVAITGASGAGKTTLLNCLAGLDQPDEGLVFFRGENLHKLSDKEKSDLRLKEMGFIFQMYALIPHFDTRENVALPAEIKGMSPKLKKRVEYLLEGTGIDEQAKQYPSQLSGGQMQRVSIARALTNSPSIIFADEPTGDLDTETGKKVMDLLQEFHKETGTTIVVITHDPMVAEYASRQIPMKDGLLKKT